MDDSAYLLAHRAVWQNKPILRRIYTEQFYRRLLDNRVAGDTLEIGSGPGFMREIDPAVIRTDIVPSTFVSAVVDGHRLPFGDEQFANVVMLDVLHHINRPIVLLHELSRVLKVGGRIIMVEPWITPFSTFVYTYLHQEVCNLTVEPWRESEQFTQGKRAFDGNAAIPYRLFVNGWEQAQVQLPQLQLVEIEQFSWLTYLLSFGFKPINALPMGLYDLTYRLEQQSLTGLGNWISLRAKVILQKSPHQVR